MLSSLSEFLGFSIGTFTIMQLLSAVLLFLLCYLISRIARRLLSRTIDHFHISESLKSFFKQILRFAFNFIIILIVADYLGLPVTSLLAVFSLLGLAISLSVQDLLGNLISGVVLLFTQPFDVGDFIEAGGISGTVKQIALFRTELDTLDNKLIHVPNSTLASSTITNYSSEELRRVDLTYAASYESPADAVKAALSECAASIDAVLSDPAPEILVSGFGDSNVNFTIRLWVKSADYWLVYNTMNDRILTYYAKHGVKMSYPKIALQQ